MDISNPPTGPNGTERDPPGGITSPRPSDNRLVVAFVVQRRLPRRRGCLLRSLQLLLQVVDALLELLGAMVQW